MSWSSGDVQANGIRLHYTRTGGGGPPLVLAHGYSDDGPCWTPVAEALQADYDVIMVDARCHGLSDAPETSFGLMDQVNDLAGAIAALGLEKPMVLGHSMGAITTLALAGQYPDLPRAILLEDPPASWMPNRQSPPMDDEARERTRKWVMSQKEKTREQLMAEQRAASPTWSEAEIGPWADSKRRLSPNVANRGRHTDLDWQSLVRHVTCPALLITADPEKGAIVKPEEAEALRALIPQLQVTHISGAGHSIHRENFTDTMQAVKSFLAQASNPSR